MEGSNGEGGEGELVAQRQAECQKLLDHSDVYDRCSCSVKIVSACEAGGNRLLADQPIFAMNPLDERFVFL